MNEYAQLQKLVGRLPSNALHQFPSGRWGFVGSVDVRLAYVSKDGAEVSEDQARQIAQFGVGFVRDVKTRAWESRDEAIQFARSIDVAITE